MATGKSLSPEENDRVREAARKLLAKHGNNQSRLAPLLGIKQGTLSSFLLGKSGAGFPLAKKVAELSQQDVYELLGHKAPDERRVEYDQAPRAVLSALPGWAEAEQEARKRYRHIPDEAWLKARELSGMDAPEFITPEFVLDVASLWLKYRRQPPAPPTSEQRAAEQAENERLERIAEELEAKRKRT